MRKVNLIVGLMVCSLSWPVVQATAQPSGICPEVGGGSLQALEARIKCLEKILSFVQVNTQAGVDAKGLAYPQVVIMGANVLIQSGSGATNDNGTPSGLGNLVLGYNEAPAGLVAGERKGSHNLIVGLEHRYSSSAGVVVGRGNTISGPFASVFGGRSNTASGPAASVSGGIKNTASGPLSSVSGGENNNAYGDQSSVSGGKDNSASTSYSEAVGDLTVRTLTITGP